jgi:hypothetical protein
VIDVQMRQQNGVYFSDVQVQFSNPQERSWPGVDQYSRFAVDLHDETRAAPPEGARPARTQHHDFQGGLWNSRVQANREQSNENRR